VSRGDFQSRENTNETVREIMRVDRNVVKDIRKKQLIWYGHVKRMEEERLPKWYWNGVQKDEDAGQDLERHGNRIS
jgi:hypothetical protein